MHTYIHCQCFQLNTHCEDNCCAPLIFQYLQLGASKKKIRLIGLQEKKGRAKNHMMVAQPWMNSYYVGMVLYNIGMNAYIYSLSLLILTVNTKLGQFLGVSDAQKKKDKTLSITRSILRSFKPFFSVWSPKKGSNDL